MTTHIQNKILVYLRKMRLRHKLVQTSREASRTSNSFIDGIEIVILLVGPLVFSSYDELGIFIKVHHIRS